MIASGTGRANAKLISVDRHDAGELVCEASNGVGESVKDTVVVNILHPPEVKVEAPTVSVYPECRFELQCHVYSYSAVSVNFYHNHHLLTDEKGVSVWKIDNIYVLEIQSCDSTLQGEFTCEAEDKFGKDSKSTNLSAETLDYISRDIVDPVIEVSNTVRRNTESLALGSSNKSHILPYPSLSLIFILFFNVL